MEEIGEKQKMAAAEGDDTDIFAYYAEPPLVAVNLFHLRRGHIVDRREFFWEDQRRVRSAGVLRVAAEAGVSERAVHPGVHSRAGRFRGSRAAGGIALSEKRGRKVEIHTPQRGQKKAMLDLVESNAQAQFRAAFPRAEAFLDSDPGRLCRTL